MFSAVSLIHINFQQGESVFIFKVYSNIYYLYICKFTFIYKSVNYTN